MRPESSADFGRRTPKSRKVESSSPLTINHVTPNRTSGLYDSNSVQDRIRQWQVQGAANAPAPDAVSVRSIPFSECPSTVSRPKSEFGDENAVRTEGRTRHKEDQERDTARSRSAPRKRIISDGHWKAKKETKDQKDARPPVPKLRPGSTHYDLSYTSNQERRSERRRSRRQQNYIAEQEAEDKPIFDDGIRAVAIEDGRNNMPALSDMDSQVDEDLAQRLAGVSMAREEMGTFSQTSIQPDETAGVTRRTSKYAEMLSRAAASPADMDAPRSRKPGLFGRTKDIFGKSDPTPSLDKRLPSIEAWLEEQPDPFVDGEAAGDVPAVEVPRPLRRRTERKRSSTEKPSLIDPNKLGDSVQPTQDPVVPVPTSRRRHRSSKGGPNANGDPEVAGTPPHEKGDGPQDAEGSPSPLRRRGARHRRQRSSPMKELTPQNELADEKEALVTEGGVVSNREPSRTYSPQRAYSPPPKQVLPSTGSRDVSTDNMVKPDSDAIMGDLTVAENNCGLTRKLTTHEDLMTVLSQPRRGRSRRSARTRSKRNVQETGNSTSVQEILEVFRKEEEKYMRELRTLVDGVIPVLLQAVLSKTDSAAAAGLFTSSSTGSDQTSFTKPIIEMGISLERLKTLHSRAPGQDADGLISWASTAHRAYKDYIQAWRLGFQDIVINLAPLEGSKTTPKDEVMARDESGDLVDTEGKKVDVAYLLKRPLVRVKALSRTFTRLDQECSKSLAKRSADLFTDLTTMAKRRNQEEQARLEDEAAANIDAMRVRDIRTMAAITGVVVDKSRRVKARDFFNLTFYHSTGQRMDCGVELIFRDNARGEPTGGDVLICEVDSTGKWLLFAPVELNSISARRGEDGFDLVVMIRGRAGLGQEWRELLALKTEDAQAVTEWINMLGSNPLPPRLNRTSSFAKRKPVPENELPNTTEPPKQESLLSYSTDHAAVSPEPLDVPLGEPSVIATRTNVSHRSDQKNPLLDKPLPRLNLGGGLASKPLPPLHTSTPTVDTRHTPSLVSSDASIVSDPSVKASLTALSSPPKSVSSNLEPTKQSRTAPVRPPISEPLFPQTPPKETQPTHRNDDDQSPRPRGLRKDTPEKRPSVTTADVRPSSMPLVEPRSQSSQIHTYYTGGSSEVSNSSTPAATALRPGYQRALSSTPSKDLPTVSKVRHQQHQPPSVPTHASQPRTPEKPTLRNEQAKQDINSPVENQIFTDETRTSRSDNMRRKGSQDVDSPSSTPTSSVLQPRPNGSRAVPGSPEKSSKRRTSSPLKHEYAPSTTSDSASDYDTESVSDSSSDTSDALMSECGDKPTPLVAITAGGRRTSKPTQVRTSTSIPSTGTRTLAPSDSASQGPYRRVPSSAAVPGHRKGRTIALICSWSDKGMWEQVHPDECSIVVSPGLIEAFEMSAAHSDPRVAAADGPDSRNSSLTDQPLVAFELTPIVALRRGTAIDISIRSPPTPNSRIKTTSIVMFRSRNPEECEALYGMINWARCNNPTYIQLQNARPRRQPAVTFNVGQDNHSRGRSSSWFNFGSRQKSSYRASSAPTPASIDFSVESSGTMASAFSALKRFGASSAFNLNRSSVIRRDGGGGGGTGGSSLYSSSSGTGTGSSSSTPAPSQLGFVPGKDGPNVPLTSAAAANGGGMVNNMKIRLYVRKGQHWENLGAARLSVLPPTAAVTATATATAESSRQPTPTQATQTTGGDISAASSPPVTPTHSRTPSNVTGTPVILGQPGGQGARGPRLPSSSHTPHRVHGNGLEKRLLITRNKDPDIVLLDAVLGESCFERIMQTGIAVKVWNEDEQIGHTGGVTMGRETVYMLQFPGTKEAQWVFQLCGSYRYAVGAGV
ncbi:hypothetical protein ABEF95_012315 [Exophiala dermatitidis]